MQPSGHHSWGNVLTVVLIGRESTGNGDSFEQSLCVKGRRETGGLPKRDVGLGTFLRRETFQIP